MRHHHYWFVSLSNFELRPLDRMANAPSLSEGSASALPNQPQCDVKLSESACAIQVAAEKDPDFQPRVWPDGSIHYSTCNDHELMALFDKSVLLHSPSARKALSKWSCDYWKQRKYKHGDVLEPVIVPVPAEFMRHEDVIDTYATMKLDWRHRVQTPPPCLSWKKGYFPREYVSPIRTDIPSRKVDFVIGSRGGWVKLDDIRHLIADDGYVKDIDIDCILKTYISACDNSIDLELAALTDRLQNSTDPVAVSTSNALQVLETTNKGLMEQSRLANVETVLADPDLLKRNAIRQAKEAEKEAADAYDWRAERARELQPWATPLPVVTVAKLSLTAATSLVDGNVLMSQTHSNQESDSDESSTMLKPRLHRVKRSRQLSQSEHIDSDRESLLVSESDRNRSQVQTSNSSEEEDSLRTRPVKKRRHGKTGSSRSKKKMLDNRHEVAQPDVVSHTSLQLQRDSVGIVSNSDSTHVSVTVEEKPTLKPRKDPSKQRCAKETCYRGFHGNGKGGCISSHNTDPNDDAWPNQFKALNLKEFRAFVESCCDKVAHALKKKEHSKLNSCTGTDITDAYRAYIKMPGSSKLTLGDDMDTRGEIKLLHKCASIDFCESDKRNKRVFHGIALKSAIAEAQVGRVQ